MNQIEVGEIFLKLGIAPTKDKKEIKKAYASKVKMVHPEENPQEWTCIYNAYKEAILWSEEKKEDTEPEIRQFESKEVLKEEDGRSFRKRKRNSKNGIKTEKGFDICKSNTNNHIVLLRMRAPQYGI